MKNYVSNNILTGCLLAFVLGLLTMVPVLRWFVWILALGMYIWLANRIVLPHFVILVLIGNECSVRLPPAYRGHSPGAGRPLGAAQWLCPFLNVAQANL